MKTHIKIHKRYRKIHDTDSAKQKALRNLLAASFAHNKTNVIGTTMASYLTRNNSRFIFSHKTVWIPLRDMASILNRNTINSSINSIIKLHSLNVLHLIIYADHIV